MESGRTLCRLHAAIGEARECAEGACPFWEEGGAALPPGCGLERLGVDVHSPELASYWLDLREQLEEARDRSERDGLRRTFGALVPPGLR